MGEIKRPDDAGTAATVRAYNEIPRAFAKLFSGFRSCVPDIQRAHMLARVPIGKSHVVEVGCGDGRDAEAAFVPHAGIYQGFDPSEGLLELARARFPNAPEDMFQLGYAQTIRYPEGTDIIIAVNSLLHVSPTQGNLGEMCHRVAAGLRNGGVLYGITKSEGDKEVIHYDNFDGVTGERVFYHHSPETLEQYAGRAGLTLVYSHMEAVPNKSWGLYTFAAVKNEDISHATTIFDMTAAATE